MSSTQSIFCRQTFSDRNGSYHRSPFRYGCVEMRWHQFVSDDPAMTSKEIIAILKKACDGSYVCEAQFRKEPSTRIIHPHGICETRRYEPVIVCVQTGGYSKSKKLPEFRNLPLEKC